MWFVIIKKSLKVEALVKKGSVKACVFVDNGYVRNHYAQNRIVVTI